MARNATLLASSCHPRHVIDNVPLGELVRTRRNCTFSEDFSQHQDVVCDRLQACSFPELTITRARNRVTRLSRQDLLKDKKSPSKGKVKISPLLFSPLSAINTDQSLSIIKRHLPMLLVEDSLKHTLREGVRFVSRRAPTLANVVSPSMFTSATQQSETWLTTNGFFRCGHRSCTACNFTRDEDFSIV